MLSFEAMKPEEREICAELAAKSFYDYEYFTDYVPDDKRRWRFLRTMLAIEVKINDGPARFFTAKEDGQIVAVAMLCDPDYRKPSDAEYIKAGFLAYGTYPPGTAWRARPESRATLLPGRPGISTC